MNGLLPGILVALPLMALPGAFLAAALTRHSKGGLIIAALACALVMLGLRGTGGDRVAGVPIVGGAPLALGGVVLAMALHRWLGLALGCRVLVACGAGFLAGLALAGWLVWFMMQPGALYGL